jgi:DNA-binding CsgD family transcriptional regulator/uncharacterized membrane protein YhaH (DUF805 family)
LEIDPVWIIKAAAMDSLRLARLTERQCLCLRHVHAHLSSKEIATRLGIGPGTVDQHIKMAMQILGVCDRRSAARMLVDHEAARPERPVEAPAETAPGALSPTINVLDDILASVRHGLGNVLDFSGRDTRAQFRRYAILLFVVGVLTPLLILQTQFILLFVRLQLWAAIHPEQAGNFPQWIRDHPEFKPDLGGLRSIMAFLALLHVALIAAALARRRHDLGRTELCGSLSLPIVTLALMLKPQLLMPAIPGVIAFVVLYALVRGGAPERIVAAIGVVGAVLSLLVVSMTPIRIGGVDLSFFVFDSIASIGFILVALRANRLWPIWMAAFNSFGLAAHLLLLTNPTIDPLAYVLVLAMTSPLSFLILFVGTRNHRLRLRHYGVDPAWTPLARRRRRAMGSAVPEQEQEQEQVVRARYIEPEFCAGGIGRVPLRRSSSAGARHGPMSIHASSDG